jgi:ribosome-associated toxin RatA of RatAB toxin-antitoxin module
MPIVEGSITIDAPAAGLFALSQDYRLRRAWDPFVREMRFEGSATEAGKGVRVWVRAWTGLTMEVEFTGFRPPTAVAMKMIRGPWFFRQFAGTWLFQQQADGRTQVTFRYFFKARGGWLARVIEPVIAWMFRRDVRGRLRGLKRGAEEGNLLERLGEPCR